MTVSSTWVIIWNPPPTRLAWGEVRVSVAEPSPQARICYTATGA
jgi:hypothetical protein